MAARNSPYPSKPLFALSGHHIRPSSKHPSDRLRHLHPSRIKPRLVRSTLTSPLKHPIDSPFRSFRDKFRTDSEKQPWLATQVDAQARTSLNCFNLMRVTSTVGDFRPTPAPTGHQRMVSLFEQFPIQVKTSGREPVQSSKSVFGVIAINGKLKRLLSYPELEELPKIARSTGITVAGSSVKWSAKRV